MKCKDGGSYFHKNQKYRRLEKEKKCIFHLFHLSHSQFFLYGLYQKMLNVLWKYSFKQNETKIYSYQSSQYDFPEFQVHWFK